MPTEPSLDWVVLLRVISWVYHQIIMMILTTGGILKADLMVTTRRIDWMVSILISSFEVKHAMGSKCNCS